MKPDSVKIVAINNEQAAAIDEKKFIDKITSGSSVARVGSSTNSTIKGSCVYLDLTKEQDRNTYAELAAKFVAEPDTYILLWEERIKSESGGLCVYMSYISTGVVSSQILATL